MPESKITIRCLRDIQTKDGARWLKGYDIETTRAELTQRGVPDDAYKVLREETNRQDAKAAKPEKK